MKEYDVRNLACPGPVLKLRELLEAGERELSFWVADELCRSNVTRFAASRKIATEVAAKGDGTFVVSFRADDGPAAVSPPGERAAVASDLPQTTAVAGPTVVQVTATTMGAGDDQLGALLMRSFIKTLVELDRKPDAVIFYNDGVKLCCEGSLLIGDLRALEAAGVEIIACGTCLNFFELGDRLSVGRVTDMLEIAGRLAEAGRVVRP
jgi:selenium metabolism protein YedF